MNELDDVIEMSFASAQEDERKRAVELDKMAEHAEKYGLKIDANVPYDGNCFFHSISHHTKMTAGWLRKDLVTFLKTKVNIQFYF